MYREELSAGEKVWNGVKAAMSVLLIAATAALLVYGVVAEQERKELVAEYRRELGLAAKIDRCSVGSNCDFLGHRFLKTSRPKDFSK